MTKKLILKTKDDPYDKFEDSRWYQLSIRISRGVWRYIWSSDVENLEGVNGKWARFAKRIFDIPGVIKVDIRPYAFSVVRNGIGHREWKDIEPKVISALKRCIGVETVEIVRLKEEQV